MNYKVIDFGKLFCIFLENELVLGFDRAVLSIKLDCRDFEYAENSIVLYGSEPNGLLRSHNTLSLSDNTYLAMHDSSAQIKALNGSGIIPNENGDSYIFTCSNGDKELKLTLNGNCRCEGNILHFRRGETKISFSAPTVTTPQPRRRGFEYEAERCLSLITENGTLTSDSELLPLLTLVNSLKTATYAPHWAENIKTLLTDMTEEGKRAAEAVLHRYYRAFGYDANNVEKGRYR